MFPVLYFTFLTISTHFRDYGLVLDHLRWRYLHLFLSITLFLIYVPSSYYIPIGTLGTYQYKDHVPHI